VSSETGLVPINELRPADRVSTSRVAFATWIRGSYEPMITIDQSPEAPLTDKSAEVGELLPAMAGVAIWLYFLLGVGVTAAVETSWLLLFALGLGAWPMLMQLRFGNGALAFTVGPWRRSVELAALASISWKMTGGGLSRGTIVVHDRRGGRVPIYVGRYSRIEEWGPFLLDAADRSGAAVDQESRHLLAGAGAPRTLHRR
jgi:hypothetical protein